MAVESASTFTRRCGRSYSSLLGFLDLAERLLDTFELGTHGVRVCIAPLRAQIHPKERIDCVCNHEVQTCTVERRQVRAADLRPRLRLQAPNELFDALQGLAEARDSFHNLWRHSLPAAVCARFCFFARGFFPRLTVFRP